MLRARATLTLTVEAEGEAVNLEAFKFRASQAASFSLQDVKVTGMKLRPVSGRISEPELLENGMASEG
jgi:hypothetical protein